MTAEPANVDPRSPREIVKASNDHGPLPWRSSAQVDAESTSAALRRVQAELDAERDKRGEDIAAYERACGLAVVAERERDRLAAAVDDLHADLNNAQQECDSAQTEVQVLRRSESLELVAAENRAITAERDRDEAADEARRLRDQLGFADGRIRTLGKELQGQVRRLSTCAGDLAEARRHKDSARAELVSARIELDAVRTARDNLDRELAEARALLAKNLTNGLDYALKQMDDHIRTADGWVCLQCGDFTTRPGGLADHPCGTPGPMPVRLTITHRTEEPS